jgi:hypothetical protein
MGISGLLDGATGFLWINSESTLKSDLKKVDFVDFFRT